jgi:hypothetical protein
MRATLLAAALAGCTGAAAVETAGVPFSYPSDDELRISDVQAKGTHNSYHVEMAGNHVPDWAYSQPPLEQQLAVGVRQIELDLTLDVDVGHFEVYHVPLADEGSTCRRFTDCLRALKGWSDRYPGHHPIYVQLEPKDGFVPEIAEAYFAQLEGEITSVWPRERVVAPADVQGAAPSLRPALAERGWPPLGTMRGKVLFALDDTGDVRRAYTRGDNDLDGRLLFVDSRPEQPYAAIAVLNDPIADAAAIRAAVAARLLVRTRADADGVEPRRGDRSRMEAALGCGAHFISSDFVVTMPGVDYLLAVPGGAPLRCNPVTAPKGCSPLLLEDPAFVGGVPDRDR